MSIHTHQSSSFVIFNASHTFHPIHGSLLLHQQSNLISNSSTALNRAKVFTHALKDIGAPPLMSRQEIRDRRVLPVSVDAVTAASPLTTPNPPQNRPRRWAKSLLDSLRNSTSLGLGGTQNNASLSVVAGCMLFCD